MAGPRELIHSECESVIGGCRRQRIELGLVAQCGVPPVVVVFLLPVADHDAGLGEGPEDVDVEVFVAARLLNDAM
jgi:hypothetical protein